jgi:sensor domain CHASE-containing protein
MLLKKKAVSLMVLTAIIIGFGLYFILDLIANRSFNKLESISVARNSQRVESIFENFISSMKSQVGDWGHWDTPWRMMVNPEEAESFYAENLSSDALSTLGVNLICFFDTSRQVVEAKGILQPGRADDREAISKCGHLATVDQLFDLVKMDSFASGYVSVTSGMPMIAVSSNIIRSDGSGPSHGYIIFARSIDSRMLAGVASMSMYPVEIMTIGHPDMTDDFKKAEAEFYRGAHQYMLRRDENTIYGYVSLRDNNKNLVAILRSEMPREIFAESAPVKWSFGLVSSVIGLLAVMIMVLTARLLDAAKTEEDAIACKVRSDELEEMNKIMVGRELKMVELKKQAEKMKREMARFKKLENPDKQSSE